MDDDNKIVPISDYKLVVKERYCPECGYMISQMIVDLALADYRCPRCKNTRLSEFIPIFL